MNEENDTPTAIPPDAAAAYASYTNAAPQAEPAPAAEAAEADAPNAAFPYAEKLAEDRVSMRDDLSKVQTSATEAARLSGDHFVRLLYGPDADLHLSPYGVPPTPNSLDSRKP